MIFRQRHKHEFALLATTGFYHTLDQWTRVLLPFAQWNLEPHVPVDGLIWLTLLTSTFTLVGTFFIAQMIEVLGLRTTALIASCLTALYQLLVCQTNHLYIFILIQSLSIFNNMQMIIDAAILHLESEDGDDKKRTRLITKLMIPTSLGLAAGPYLALQMIFFVTPSLELSQSLCALATMLTIVPLIWFFFSDTPNLNNSLKPQISSYFHLLKNERTQVCTILLMMVSGPFAAYDTIIRVSLASSTIRDPQSMHILFMIIGLTAIIVNLIVLPRLQERLSPKNIIIGSFALLTISYSYLSIFQDYQHLLIGMPLQVIGATICIGELSSQLMGTVGKKMCGKAAALLRISQLCAALAVPFFTGTYHSDADTTRLCVFSACLSAISILIVRNFGSFMQFNSSCLPGLFGKID